MTTTQETTTMDQTFGTAWCPECRQTQTIEDVSTEGTYEHGRETQYGVQFLACGHQNHTARHDVGQAPGAPYAPGALSLRDATTWGRLTATLADPFARQEAQA